MDYEIYETANFELQSGAVLPTARLAYKTHGTLNAAKDNVIVYPSRYAGTHEDQVYLIGEGMALDPAKYFIVCLNMMGSGLSSSPSNTPAPFDGPRFPKVTQFDNVTLQAKMLREVYGIDQIALAVGWSMGGQQAFQWASMFPDQVAAMSCMCGQGTTAPHTYAFLTGVKQGIISDPAWNGGDYEDQPWDGLTSKGRIWCSWALTQEWYRARKWAEMGYETVQDYITGEWDKIYYHRDANDMLSLIATWQACDLGNNPIYNGDTEAAYRAIKARAILLPGNTDMYFPTADNEAEAALMPNAEVREIQSIWAHYAAGGKDPADTAFVDAALKELLPS
ncbi:MAG: alpha/beta fold hydrolase [Pseudomonadota bacterium]